MTTPESAGEVHPEPLVRRIDLADMIAYAGSTWDWHRIHYDQAYIEARRIPAPIVDGQVFGALLAEQAQSWAGPSWRLASMNFRFSAMVFAGETVRCELSVAERNDVDAAPTGAAEHEDQRIVLTGRVVETAADRVAVSKVRIELCRR